MTKVSRIPIDQKRMNEFYDDFWSGIALLETKKEARSFLFDLLTHTERKMLAKRLQVAIMLIEGYDYRTIRAYVRVTDVTIAKINNWFNTGAFGLIKIAERLIKLKKKKLEEKMKGKKQYLAGDLLTPALEEGLGFLERRIKKHRKKRSIIKSRVYYITRP